MSIHSFHKFAKRSSALAGCFVLALASQQTTSYVNGIYTRNLKQPSPDGARIEVNFHVTLLGQQIAPQMGMQAPQAQACIDFEQPLYLGTRYGAATGLTSGSHAFTANGIPVAVYQLAHGNGASSFNEAHIDLTSSSPAFGSGQTIRMNNINLEFDFDQLPFQAKRVTIYFLDRGGYENLSVNKSRMFIGELSATPGQLGGVRVTNQMTTHPHSKTGILTLTGLMHNLRIGGQELWLDHVCAFK